MSVVKRSHLQQGKNEQEYLLKEYVGMSTASAVRNPQSNYLAIKKKNTASFGKLPHKFKS
ncbi:hypothetical protein [Clostridium saccharobutylicum]|uniref:hypothetical protein n=1 Tax=Clostridium saccharobutylicum TaxID=169679 RepID=UPI000AFB94BF|nr:hypothetical protein [Clostridium saccharobutylicum]